MAPLFKVVSSAMHAEHQHEGELSRRTSDRRAELLSRQGGENYDLAVICFDSAYP